MFFKTPILFTGFCFVFVAVVAVIVDGFFFISNVISSLLVPYSPPPPFFFFKSHASPLIVMDVVARFYERDRTVPGKVSPRLQ